MKVTSSTETAVDEASGDSRLFIALKVQAKKNEKEKRGLNKLYEVCSLS